MLRYAALLTVAFVLPNAVPLQADEQAQATIDKAIAALGGEAALKDLGCMSWKVKGKMHAFGDPMPYQAKYSFKSPDKLRFDMEMNFQGQDMKLIVVSNGKQAWEVGMGQEREMAPEKFKEFKHTSYAMNVTMLLPLKDPAFKLTSLGESKEGDKTLVGVKVAKDSERDVSLFFDKATGLLYKSSFRAFNEIEMKEVNQDVYFENYVAKDGKQVFSKMTIKHDGKVFIEEEMSDQQPKPIDDKFFEKP